MCDQLILRSNIQEALPTCVEHQSGVASDALVPTEAELLLVVMVAFEERAYITFMPTFNKFLIRQ